jgi:putative Ca2+/H+ antiporter (TMEM165/GDT1 family)
MGPIMECSVSIAEFQNVDALTVGDTLCFVALLSGMRQAVVSSYFSGHIFALFLMTIFSVSCVLAFQSRNP